MASDGGNRSSSVDLTVFITNVHNQPPQWEQPEYWVTVPENTARDAKIVVGVGGKDRSDTKEPQALLEARTSRNPSELVSQKGHQSWSSVLCSVRQ